MEVDSWVGGQPDLSFSREVDFATVCDYRPALVILGIIALAVPSITYFTTERVAHLGFLRIEVSRPHTIVFNPIVGVVALIAGIVLLSLGRHPA